MSSARCSGGVHVFIAMSGCPFYKLEGTLATFYIRGTIKKFPEFFDIDNLVHHEFVSPGQSVTGHFYMEVLQRKRRDKWQGYWFPSRIVIDKLIRHRQTYK
jgi:hypothetical protein